jgi:hypothetical protein
MIIQSYGNDIISCDRVENCQKDKIGISIIYAYEDSDLYYPAKLIKHGTNCLCFASKEPIAEGEKIYIMTQDFPIEAAYLKIYEGCLARVEECKKNENFRKKPFYLIRGKSMSGKTLNISSNKIVDAL